MLQSLLDATPEADFRERRRLIVRRFFFCLK
jgi:hypothetical protein